MSSSVTRIVAPLDSNSVAVVRLKVCQPIRFVIPARNAAGRMCRRMIVPGQ